MTTNQGLYNSIDVLPIKVWHKILSTNDLDLLYIPIKSDDKKPSKKKKKSVDLSELWLDIQQEFFDEFGVDVEFQIRINKMKKYIILMCEWIITNDRKLLNSINMLDLEMRMWGEQQTIKFYDLVSKVERMRKVPVDLDNCTVIRWYHILKDATEAAKKPSTDGY